MRKTDSTLRKSAFDSDFRTDPFNRQPLTVAQLVSNSELKERIDQWRANKKQKPATARTPSLNSPSSASSIASASPSSPTSPLLSSMLSPASPSGSNRPPPSS